MRRRTAAFLFLATAMALTVPSPARAGDAFLKFGLFLHPDMGDFSDSWLFSGGSDWGFAPMGFWGLEFQGAYWSEEIEGLSITSVPANVLLNFKFKADTETVRPYAGAGVGLISTYVRAEYLGESDNEWIKDAGMQFMGGVEFNRRFAVEILGQKAFDEDAEFSWVFLAGIRW